MIEIVPAFLVQSEKEFETNLRLVEDDCQLIQVDVLDGSLFPNTCWHDAERVGALRTDVKMELHLMTENPIPIIESWKQHVPTLTRAIVHAEMHRPSGTIIGYIRDELKMEAGIAINPETPISAIENVLHSVQQVTLMSVNPGFQGQPFGGDPERGTNAQFIIDKIERLRKHQPDLIIEIDGGITQELIEPLVNAGANRLGIGSAIFGTEDPRFTLRHMNELITRL